MTVVGVCGALVSRELRQWIRGFAPVRAWSSPADAVAAREVTTAIGRRLASRRRLLRVRLSVAEKRRFWALARYRGLSLSYAVLRGLRLGLQGDDRR